MAKAGKIFGKIGLGLLIAAVAAVAGGMITLLTLSAKTVVEIVKEEVKFHTVRFSYDNNVISTQAVVDGKTPVAPYLPSTVTDHNGYEYEFAGWTNDGETIVDPNTITVTENANYAALFKFSGYVATGAMPTEYVGTYTVPENNQKVTGDGVWQYTDADGVEHVFYSNNTYQYKLADDGVTWESQTWTGLTSFNCENVWQYNGNVYYSDGAQYKLNADENKWESITWKGLSNFQGKYIWQYKGDVYYSTYNSSDYYDVSQYKLSDDGETWTKIQAWRNTRFHGNQIWHYTDADGVEHVCRSDNSNSGNRKLDDDGETWILVFSGASINATGIWQHNGNVYYNGFKLSFSDETVESQTWAGKLFNIQGKYIWQHDGNVYYSNGSSQYKLADDGNTWQRIMYPAAGELDIQSSRIWNDKDNTYYGGEYRLEDGKWVTLDWKLDKAYIIGLPYDLVQYTDADGVEHMYYLKGNTQYKFTDDRTTWEDVSLNYSYGENVWQHDGNVYYSNNTYQYKLNANKRWESHTWAGLTMFYGKYVWQHGNDVYYSKDSEQYKLADDGVTWEEQTWTGLTSFSGDEVFHIGDQAYVKYNNKLYHLVDNEWQRVTLKQSILGRSEYCTIGDESFFGYQNVKYELKDIYYCPEAKLDNEYVNNHALDKIEY